MRAAANGDARCVQVRLGRDPVQERAEILDTVGTEPPIVEPLVGTTVAG